MTFEERTKILTGKLDQWENELFILQAFNTENFAPKKITGFFTEEVRYGMTEEDFIKYGKILNDDTEEENN